MDELIQQDEKINEPLLPSLSESKGGFRAFPFIIGSQGLGTMAYFGLDTNMIIYLTKDYGMKVANGSNIINLYEAFVNFTPIFGAFLADSFVGRFRMIGFGCIILTLGTMLFWSTTIIPGAKPYCDHDSLAHNTCTPIKPLHLFILLSSYTLIAIGSGSCRASGLAFGADQLRCEQGNGSLESYFNWYFIVIFSSLIFSQTCFVYIQDHTGWIIGFGIPVLIMLAAAIVFFLGAPIYFKSDPEANLITSMVQVVVASWKNRHYDLSSQGDRNIERMYHVVQGSKLSMPSDRLKFLNKACIIKNTTQDVTSEGLAMNPWSLCTIDQVEDLKSLINIIPLWSIGILFNLSALQGSFRIIQAKFMDCHVFKSSFEIPPASFGIFAILTTILWLTLYDNMLLPLASKLMNKQIHINAKVRMGIALILSITYLVTATIVESFRRNMATKEKDFTRPMSALWLLPQICIMGLAEGVMITAQNEFFYSELPKNMASIASNLYYLSTAISGFVASFVVSVIDNVTRKGGKEGWLSNDPNKGHYDYYYGILVGLGLVNYMYFLVCSRTYDNGKRFCQDEKQKRDHETLY